jgi:hypothetical protein
MKKATIIIFLTCFTCSSVNATDNLRISDMRALSLGGGATETILYNPALLPLRTQIIITDIPSANRPPSAEVFIT